MLTAVLQHQAGWSPRGGRHRFGSAASGELQRPRLKCRTVIICPENGSFLGEDCAGWCRGSGWWKRQAARDAGAACRRALHRGPGSRPPRVPLSLTFGTGHRPLLPSGSVPLASVANHGHRNCQRLGASLVFPTESAARAATVRGARVDSGHCIWGRTVGWCGLGEQARHGKLLPGDGDRVRADG